MFKFFQNTQTTKTSIINLPAINHPATDPQKLHREFVRLGGMRHKLKNRMLAILPEIYKSGIYKKYAGSIVEYAGKYGDIAKTTVIKRLRLEENLQDKPYLKAAIEKVGVHKVAMVAKITTPETDKPMAENLLNMSKMAVQSLSKELRAGQWEDHGQNADQNQQDRMQNQLFVSGDQSSRASAPPCKAIPCTTKKIELDEESTFLFLKLKAKLGKYLSDKDFLKLILKEREKREFPRKQSGIINQADSLKNVATNKISDQKSITGDSHERKRVTMPIGQVNPPKNITGEAFHAGKNIASSTFEETRYIRADKKRRIIGQTNGKCSYPDCNSPFQVLHHSNRYNESKNHDSVIPLCKIHHEFAHNNLIQNEILGADQWKLSVTRRTDIKISNADILYRKYRREALHEN